MNEIGRLFPGVLWGVMIATFLCGGCGRRYELVPVAGRLTFDGAERDVDGYVYFVPEESGTAVRPGSARLLPGGRFEVMSYADADGLMPGRYKVRITCWDPGRKLGNAVGRPDLIDDTETLRANLVPSGFTLPSCNVTAGQPRVWYEVDVPSSANYAAPRNRGGAR